MLYLYPGVIVMDIVLFCMKLSNKGPLWVLSTHYLSATYDGQLKQWCHHLYTKISHVLKLNILLMKTSMADNLFMSFLASTDTFLEQSK